MFTPESRASNDITLPPLFDFSKALLQAGLQTPTFLLPTSFCEHVRLSVFVGRIWRISHSIWHCWMWTEMICHKWSMSVSLLACYLSRRLVVQDQAAIRHYGNICSSFQSTICRAYSRNSREVDSHTRGQNWRT